MDLDKMNRFVEAEKGTANDLANAIAHSNRVHELLEDIAVNQRHIAIGGMQLSLGGGAFRAMLAAAVRQYSEDHDALLEENMSARGYREENYS